MSTIVASATKNRNVFYAAVRTETTQEIWGLVVLLSYPKGHYNFGYKEMDETQGSYYYDMPLRILNLLTETTNETANAWRKVVRLQADKSGMPKAWDKVRFDTPIRFKGVSDNVFTVIPNKRSLIFQSERYGVYVRLSLATQRGAEILPAGVPANVAG